MPLPLSATKYNVFLQRDMISPTLNNIEACGFDAYGTLFDVHSAAARLKDELGEKAEPLSEMWRQKQLQYTWLRSLMGQHKDFWQVTGDALDYSMHALGIHDPSMRSKLMELYLQLDAYPDVEETLLKLKDHGIRVAILSNGEPSMLVAAAKSAGIYSLLDNIISVERVRVFKPHSSVYQLGVEYFKVPANQIAFQSSNGWDAHAAGAYGLTAVWVNRFRQPPERLPKTPLAEISSLSDLPKLLGL